MARLVINPEEYFLSALTRRSRVLLVNPPVHERRYHWLRWNQPVELLRLSAWLKQKHRGLEVKLFDFMAPDPAGGVPKHKVKETWSGTEHDEQLWHFGRPFEAFEEWLSTVLQKDHWVPDCIVVSSLTSYWHEAVEKLLPKLCTKLGRRARERLDILLYGNYPRFEPEHAAAQPDADLALRGTVGAQHVLPDWDLYGGHLPLYFGLDVAAPNLEEHLEVACRYHVRRHPKIGRQRPPAMTIAFLNDDVWARGSRLEDLVKFKRDQRVEVVVEGIAGIVPASLTLDRLACMKEAGFRSLFVEHSRLTGGGLNSVEYEALCSVLTEEEHAKRTGRNTAAWLDGGVTAFVAVGLPDDDLDKIVRTSLELNRMFQSIIMKPFGYSPDFDNSDWLERQTRWVSPSLGSPQRFPYVGNGSRLTLQDYGNLLAWQNLVNKRVKGATFDFLGEGLVPAIVRETLVTESWKPHPEVE